MRYDLKKQLRSFRYAWQGIRQCVGREQNLSFHLITTVLVIGAGFAFGITRGEWVAICLIERLVDLVSPQRNPLAGQVKDIAAGAVLVCALAAIAVGLIIFVPYLTRIFL